MAVYYLKPILLSIWKERSKGVSGDESLGVRRKGDVTPLSSMNAGKD
jgi:hypothetical protein